MIFKSGKYEAKELVDDKLIVLTRTAIPRMQFLISIEELDDVIFVLKASKVDIVNRWLNDEQDKTGE